MTGSGAGVRHYDVVVAGAGPAGARVARDLAAAGFTVALLEEHAEVGVPWHCSGLVTPRTLARAEVGDDLVVNAIRGAEFHLPSGRSLALGGDRVHAYAIDRPTLDRRLVCQATDAGATLLTGTRYVRHQIHGSAHGGPSAGGVSIDVERDGQGARFEARLLVGADGARSRVATHLGGSAMDGFVAAIGVLSAADPAEPADRVAVFLDPEAAPGWFGWSIPLGNGTVRLGTGSANGITPHESLDRLARHFPGTFADRDVLARGGGTIALWRPTRIVGDRVMLVGDAARQVKPTSGGGVHAALVAAGLAARAGAAALHVGDLSERQLGAYETAWKRSLGREMRRGHDLRRVFERLTPARLERLFDALEHPPLRRSVQRVADIDFPSRVAWAIARHDPLLAIALATVPRFPFSWMG